MDEIAAIYEVDRDRVSQWLQWWREFEFEGLEDDKRAGRPPKLSAEERKQALELVNEEPRSIKRAVSELSARSKKK